MPLGLMFMNYYSSLFSVFYHCGFVLFCIIQLIGKLSCYSIISTIAGKR